MDNNQIMAVAAYEKSTGRKFVPGECVALPTDAFAFTEYQKAYLTIEEYREKRCNFDDETNDWLEFYVTDTLMSADIPAIYVDVTDDGIALVDGVHRVTGAFLTGHPFVYARLNQE